ncbi:MAG: hypothetical protein JWN72_1476 [Thermoleophilia bacterium]|nr:hypothetical protein [Thermoleophilia bacterium]
MNIPQIHRRRDEGRGLPERVTLAVSIAVLAALLGGLVMLNAQAGSAPAALQVEPDYGGVFRRHGSWYLPVEVTNSGDEATDAVTVALEQETDDPDHPETADLDFAFVAGGETVSGYVAFDAEPTADNVTVDPVSYTNP